jgi:hypothetical protein
MDANVNDDQARRLVRSLEEITTEAKVIYNRMEKDYYKLGELLLEAKEQVPYGRWQDYLEEHFPAFGRRQAQRYMKMVSENKSLPEVTARSVVPKTTHESFLPAHSEVKEHQAQEFRREVTKLKRENEALFENRMKFAINRIKEALGNGEVYNALHKLNRNDLTDPELDLVQELINECGRLRLRANYWEKSLSDHFEMLSTQQHRETYGDE